MHWTRIAKDISYVLAPILIVILLASLMSVAAVFDSGKIDGKDYYSSTCFSDQYFERISDELNKLIEIEKKSNTSVTVDDMPSDFADYYNYYNIKTMNYQNEPITLYSKQAEENFVYLIVDNKENRVYTNIDYSVSEVSIDSYIEEIKANIYNWSYENNNVETSVEKMNLELSSRQYFFKDILKSNRYTVYTAIMDGLPYFDVFLREKLAVSIIKGLKDVAVFIIPFNTIVLLAMLPIVFIGIGKKKGSKEITLNFLDKVHFELVIAFTFFAMFSLCGLFLNIANSVSSILSLIFFALALLSIYVGMIIMFETTIKRIKAHKFWETTLLHWILEKIKLIFDNMKVSLKIGIIFASFVIVNWLIFDYSFKHSFLSFVMLLALYAASFIFILKKCISYENIFKAIEKMYNGNNDINMNENEYKGKEKKVVHQLNDIAGGLENAINEKMKSERLKTELITNVSHDIKTPLTSIINYVDLLKKEDIKNEKAQEYIGILDSKSQRLKKLTDDLVEASKSSSGNIKLDMEKLEVNELIKQVSAEFDDKYKANGLEEIITYTNEPAYIKADSRYMYRVLENMYSNVSKYAMKNTRVYTDILKEKGKVIIKIKNISSQKLNISVDELMQRFVRGDSSRNTEGSGLGLSIANSLTNLQGGEFNIYLDGDLFKITIVFDELKENKIEQVNS